MTVAVRRIRPAGDTPVLSLTQTWTFLGWPGAIEHPVHAAAGY